MPTSTEICNFALTRIGCGRIADFTDDTDTSLPVIQCRMHFEQTAKALMRSHFWRFAKKRVQLSQHTDTPAFQWSYKYALPSDFLRMISVYTGSELITGRSKYSWELEGNWLMTDDSTCYIRYIAWISDTGAWDPLFIEVMTLMLARKLCVALTQDVATTKADLDKDLVPLMSKVRALDRNEGEMIGEVERKIWRDARYSDTA